MKVYTKKGDSGTTGLLYGGRVHKDSEVIEANGAVDEAQAALGAARAEARRDSELDQLLTGIERDLWVLMAEVATAPDNRSKLVDGSSKVTKEMVDSLERKIDEISERFDMPSEFVVPGQDRLSAQLDVARTAVRRAERRVLAVVPSDSLVVPYLNRLSDLVWTMARWQEGEHLFSRLHPVATDDSGPVG